MPTTPTNGTGHHPGPAASRGLDPRDGDTISVYYGEFLTSPCPLELSFNFCSHHCYYCFANLGKPGRFADVGRTIRLLAGMDDRETLEAHLLRERYPVVVSNRVDPFAASNYRQSVPVLRQMAGLGIPVAIQTRGGYGVDEALSFLQPSVWYISVVTLDDDLRKAIEPGAPTTDSRFELITRARDRGHRVIVGLNPCVQRWCPDPAALLRRVKDAGAEATWIELLHLSTRLASRMNPRERSAVGEDLIADARKRKRPEAFAHQIRAREAAKDLGLHVHSVGQHEPTGLFDLYRACYPRTFPVLQDLTNLCHERGLGPADAIPAAQIADWFAERLPGGTWPLAHYIGAANKDVLRDIAIPTRMDYRQLLMHLLDDPRARGNPVRSAAFAYAAQWDGDGWIQMVDVRGEPYFLFERSGCFSAYSQFEGVCRPGPDDASESLGGPQEADR